MTGNRPNCTWIWVAVAAITLASLARAQSGIEHARACATPVMKFLAASQLPDSGAASPVRRTVSRSQAGANPLTLELLPVFFVGLIAPLNPLSGRSVISIGSASRAVHLPDLFQRPPPAHFASI